MATNKKFRIQNGVDIHGGGLSIDDVTVIGADGKVVESAIADAVAGLTSSDIADLQAQVSAILGTSPETLDTLQEIVAAFEGADSTLTGSVAQNAADIATINTTLTNGVATPTDVADLQSQITSNDTDIAANAAAIAAANSRTSGISTSSGSSNIQMTAEVDMDSNNITNAGDVYAARGFIDRVEAEQLVVETGTVSFAGSTVDFGSTQITGGGFSTATNEQIDQHLNKSAAGTNEFLKWNGSDYEFTDYIEGQLATNMITVEGTLRTEQPGSTIDWQNGLVHFGGSQVIVDDPSGPTEAANKRYVDETDSDQTAARIAGDAASVATAAADATAKADAAEANAKAHADTGDATVQAAVDVVSGRVDAILNGSGESLDTIVEIVAAFEDADSDLQTLISSNASAVSTETARAQAAESGLQSSIDSLTSSTSGDVSGLQGQIDDEEAARISGDASLQSQLNSEITRATSAEAVNAANIASEITARSNADAAIEADVVALQNQVGTILGGAPGTLDTFVEIINAFEGADSDLQSVISSNSTRLTTAENNITALEADLTAEENARASGDSALQAQITANDTDIASNASAISAEETRATAAESGLQAQITSNDGDISALQTRAGTIEGKDADQDVAIAANTAAISAETSRAQTAEGAIASDLATEVSRAQTAEAALQSSIDFVKQNTDPAALDSLTEIVAAFQSADDSITGVVTSNTTRISALEGGVTAIEAWSTDNVSEGSTNLYFTEARAKACVGADANSCIDYDEASGKFSLDIAETEGALVPDNATNADQLDGQHGDYYRINIYNVAGTLVN